MCGQHLANFVNRLCQGMAEFFILKMNAHSIHNALPELFAAFFMNRLVTNNRELVRPRSNENKNGIALVRLVHSEPLELFLRNDQRIGVESTALDIDANFA